MEGKNLLKVHLGLPLLLLAARWDRQTQLQVGLAPPAGTAQVGEGIWAPGLAEQHQSVSVVTWGCHPTAAMALPILCYLRKKKE